MKYILSVLSSLIHRTQALIEAMRPHHWVKNVIVFAAPLFALAFSASSLLSVGWGFIAFSMSASAFYLVNDVRDIEADRNHPVKQHRPIAKGLVPIPLALGSAGVLIMVSLLGSYIVAPRLALTIALYALIQAGYNLGLKEEPIIDIMVIAGGFVLRALGGAVAAGVSASGWFILCIGLLALFLGIEKRKAELEVVGNEEKTRSVLQVYSGSWLRRMESVATSGAIMTYALWTLEGADTKWMLVTVPIVLYAVFRYQYLTEVKALERPEEILTNDRNMTVSIILWGLLSLLILIVKNTTI